LKSIKKRVSIELIAKLPGYHGVALSHCISYEPLGACGVPTAIGIPGFRPCGHGKEHLEGEFLGPKVELLPKFSLEHKRLTAGRRNRHFSSLRIMMKPIPNSIGLGSPNANQTRRQWGRPLRQFVVFEVER
jgi:hypothetical protein